MNWRRTRNLSWSRQVGSYCKILTLVVREELRPKESTQENKGKMTQILAISILQPWILPSGNRANVCDRFPKYLFYPNAYSLTPELMVLNQSWRFYPSHQWWLQDCAVTSSDQWEVASGKCFLSVSKKHRMGWSLTPFWTSSRVDVMSGTVVLSHYQLWKII